MATIQSTIALYSVVETILRQALQENRPRTFKELSQHVDVKRVAKNEQQLRDVVSRFRNKGMIVNKKMREFSDAYKSNESGWIWAADNEVVPVALPKHKVDKKPSIPVITMVESTKADKDVELCFNGTTILVGRNPISGRIRITIEG